MENQPNHPLDDLEYIYDWDQWKKVWEENKTADVRLGLLHIGFGVRTGSIEKNIERLIFYLTVADGHLFASNFKSGDSLHGNRINTALGNFDSFTCLQQNLSEKAFSILALKFFKNFLDGSYEKYDEWLFVTNADLFEKILWFFRSEENESILYNVDKHTKSVHMDIMRNFLSRFYAFVFTLKGFEGYTNDEKNKKIYEQIKKRWPRFVQIIYFFGETHKFLEEDFRHVLEDKPSFEKLKTLVMESNYHLPSTATEERYRKPKTLKEAVFAGSQAAKTLFLFETISAEKKKFEEIRKAEELKKDAERILEKYTK